MAKIPIEYKSYDNRYAAPMGICLSLGVTFLLGGLMGNQIALFAIGIIGIILFFIFKYLNCAQAKEEAEENLKARMDYYKNEVENVVNNEGLSDREKISKIIEFSNEGNIYATLFLSELSKNIEEGE